MLQDPLLTPYFRVDGVVATVDAIQGERELRRQRVSLKQVAIADRIVLTKSDIAAPQAVARLQSLLANLNRWAPVIMANHGDLEHDWLLSPIDQALERLNWRSADHQHESHNKGVESFCLWLETPVRWESLQRALARLAEHHGERLLRIKGLLNIHGQSHPSALHGVNHFLHPPVSVKAWPDEDQRSRIVFITDQLAESVVRSFFMDFLPPVAIRNNTEQTPEVLCP